MRYKDAESGIEIDSDFSCASAGEIKCNANGFYEIGYQPEEIPQWFQDLLNELFDGRGVPKEYMAHVRVRNSSDSARRITLRFLLSPKGAGYMYPPWWVRLAFREWTWIPAADTRMVEREYVDTSLTLAPGETGFVASAPYEDPESVIERAAALAQRSNMLTYREIGRSANGRPLPVLETEARPLKILVDATMQSSEPVSWGVMHVAHRLTIPTARTRRLLEKVQFCLMPMMNPDGVHVGHSVTNAVGEVPKFGVNNLVEGGEAPKETEALWNYLVEMKPDVAIDVHAHFTRDGFTRSVCMHDPASMPAMMQDKARAIERAIFDNYHAAPLDNRKVLIDPRRPEHDVYGDRHISERIGTIRTSLQSVPDSIEAHCADVREMVETVAEALIAWNSAQSGS